MTLLWAIALASLAAGPPGKPLPMTGQGAVVLDGRGEQLLLGHPLPSLPNADPAPRLRLERWTGGGCAETPLGATPVSTARFLDSARLVVTTPDRRLLIVPLDGRPPRLVDRSVTGVAGSTPDGRSLVYSKGDAPDQEIWRLDPGTGPRQLTRGMAPAWSPAMSPDGRVVVFASMRSRLPAVWRIGVGDGEPPVPGDARGSPPLPVMLTALGVVSRPGEAPAVSPFPASPGAPLVLAGRLIFEDRDGVHHMTLEGGDLRTLPGARAPHWRVPGRSVAVVKAGRLVPLVLGGAP